jgi:hypothetical protein
MMDRADDEYLVEVSLVRRLSMLGEQHLSGAGGQAMREVSGA